MYQAVVDPRGQEDGEPGGKKGVFQAFGGLIDVGLRSFHCRFAFSCCIKRLSTREARRMEKEEARKENPQASGGLIYLGLRSFHCRFAFSCCIKRLSTREVTRIEKEEARKENPRRPEA